ncbi:MAG: metal-dependent transcriptional regulator [Phycisphaerae bacterium]
MSGTGQLTASQEDYLEVIFHLVAAGAGARAKDIGKRLGVAKSSVTEALQSLAKGGLVNYLPYSSITLTRDGEEAAREVVRRHEVLRDFLVKVLLIDEVEADEQACRMEHAISRSTLERLIEFAEFVERCPRGGSKWIKGFGYHCDHGEAMDSCEKCVELVFEDVRSKKMTNAGQAQPQTVLSAMKPGDKGAIVKVGGSGGIRRRLLDMGATPGTLVEVERVAPLGDPIGVKIKGYHLSLRKEEAQRIQVRAVLPACTEWRLTTRIRFRKSDPDSASA